MSPRAVIIALLILLFGGLGYILFQQISWDPAQLQPSPSPVASEAPNTACTLDAKICPDGSSVGRTGPNCEFGPCPEAAGAESQAAVPTEPPFTARFTIYTNGLKRVFTQAMYHHQSTVAFITASDPSQVQVEVAGTNWADFFASLPMELTADCLITGTGQQFCTGAQGTLSFYLNDQLQSDALSQPIKAGDELEVRYE